MEVLAPALLVLQLMIFQEVSVDTNNPLRTSLQRVEKRSHADQDHYNALPDLLDRFQIGELVIPSGFVNEQNPGASLLLGPGSDTRHPGANDRRAVNLEPGLDAVHGAPSATRLAPRNPGQRPQPGA